MAALQTPAGAWQWALAALRVSRPGFWMITLWCFLVGLGGRGLGAHPGRWLGLMYATAPVNLLLYAWNDLGDETLDLHNPRKGRYLVGANGLSRRALEALFRGALALNVLWLAGLARYVGGAHTAAWFAAACLCNALYNGPLATWRRGPPPLDFVGPLGYLLLIPLGCWTAGRPAPAAATVAFHVCMVMRSQLWGQIIDLDVDTAQGRDTTAVRLGARGARALLALLVAGELAVALAGVRDAFVTAFSALSLGQALVELAFFPPRPPDLWRAAWTGVVLTTPATALLLRVASQEVFP